MNEKRLGLVVWGIVVCISASLFAHQQEHVFIDSFGLQDLNVLDSLFTVIDKTQTTIGKNELRFLFQNPLSNKDSLTARQQVIKTLVQDKVLRSRLKALLSVFREHEAHFQLSGDPIQQALTQNMIKHFYFQAGPLQKFNESALALDCLHLYEKSMLFSPLVEHLLLHVVKDFFAHSSHHLDHHHDHAHHHGHTCSHHHHHDHHDHTCSVSLLEDMCRFLGFSPGIMQKAMSVIIVGHFLVHILSAKEMVEHIQSKNNVMTSLHHMLAHFKEAMIASKKMMRIVSENTKLIDCLDDLVWKDMCMHLNQDGPLKNMVSTLEAYDFDTHNTIGFFSRVGHTLSSYKQLEKVHNNFDMVLKGIGRLDAYVALAELYDSYATEEKQCCFVEFVEEEYPLIDIEAFYHPLIAINPVITNNCLFGHESFRHGIITGPNKAGKSTYIKALALNVLCGHVGGFMFAKRASLTPFDMIVTYINIHDDLLHDQSKFVAEVLRADQCMQRLQSLTKQSFGLCIIDDSLFSSTHHQQSVQAAYSFVKGIGNFHNVISLTVTHLPELTELEHDMPGVFKNYRIKITADSDNTPRSEFILEEGMSDMAKALDLMQVQGYSMYAENDIIATSVSSVN